MDLLKIFRMQEPVPQDLLAKNSEIGKFKEVVQEKDILLHNCKARVTELEQQVSDLEHKNRQLESQAKSSDCKHIMNEYEVFFSNIMSESQEIIQEKNVIECKLKEMELFSKNILEKYEKSKEVISQYEKIHEKLRYQILEHQDMINSLTYEYNRIRDYFETKVGETGFYADKEFQVDLQQKLGFKDLLVQKQTHNNVLQKQILERRCAKSMFEPLKGLDK